jgi:hypothetical protein
VRGKPLEGKQQVKIGTKQLTANANRHANWMIQLAAHHHFHPIESSGASASISGGANVNHDH